MSLAQTALLYQVSVETAHFARDLPAGMTWEMFDELLRRVITLASIDQWCAGDNSFAVSPENCEQWLQCYLDQAALASAKFCIATGFRRLLQQNRVRPAMVHPRHLPPVLPLPPYPVDGDLVARYFPKAWASRPAPPPIGWDAFKSMVLKAIDTLAVYGRLEDPPNYLLRYGALIDFLTDRGWRRYDLHTLLPVTLSRCWLEDHPPLLLDHYPRWHPALVLDADHVTQAQQRLSEATG